MTKALAVVGVMACAMLAACSKPASAPEFAADDDEGAATSAAPAPDVPRPSMGPADYPAKLLPMIEERAECQSFRDELQAAGQVQSSDPLPIDINEVNKIVARAGEVGCVRKESGAP